MDRVPNTGPAERERLAQIKRYTSLLREMERVPPHRREDECADVRADMCRRMLGELGAPGYPMPVAQPATVEVVDIDELIRDLGRGATPR